MTKQTATALGSALVALEAREVKITATVEPCSASEARLRIRGLPEVAEREARVRVRSALGYDAHAADVVVEDFPRLADPSCLDLPIAVAVMRAMGARVEASADTVFTGELALDGRVRGVRGALCRVGTSPIALPADNAWEAGLASGAEVYAVRRLADFSEPLPLVEKSNFTPHVPYGIEELPELMREIVRQLPLRALLVGPPGSGATLVARVACSSAQPLSKSEANAVARIYGAAGLIGDAPLSAKRPFRCPHHTVSEAGLVGGGERPRPGEASLAHRGVLLLDEIAEFRRNALEALARVLDDDGVFLARSNVYVSFPASPLAVIGTATPCPCGYRGHATRVCHCNSLAVERHEKRLGEVCRLFRFRRIDLKAIKLAEIS